MKAPERGTFSPRKRAWSFYILLLADLDWLAFSFLLTAAERRQRIAYGVSRGMDDALAFPAPEGRQTMAATFANLLRHLMGSLCRPSGAGESGGWP